MPKAGTAETRPSNRIENYNNFALPKPGDGVAQPRNFFPQGAVLKIFPWVVTSHARRWTTRIRGTPALGVDP